MSFLIRTLPSVPEFPIGSPDQPLSRVMDYTIGRDFHPATKTSIFFYQDDFSILCNLYYSFFAIRCLCLIDFFRNYHSSPGYFKFHSLRSPVMISMTSLVSDKRISVTSPCKIAFSISVISYCNALSVLPAVIS